MPRWTPPNPFAGLPHPRRVLAWAMYDLANQSFTLIINTLLFALFFKRVVLAEGEPTPGERTPADLVWSAVVATSLLIVVVVGPVIGAYADAKACKKTLLMLTAAVCAGATMCFGLIPAGAEDAWLWPAVIAVSLYITANVAFNLGENFLASFLPEVSTRRTIGKVSAIGWTAGYIGALALLIILAAAIAIFGLEEPGSWRPLLVFAGVWFAVMVIPTALGLPETAVRQPIPPGLTAFGIAWTRLRASAQHASNYRDLVRTLTAFLVYGFGVQTVIFFAGVIAKDDFGFGTTQLVLFTLQLTVTAGIGAVLAGVVQQKLGHLRTVLAFLGVWTLTALGLATITFLRETDPDGFPAWTIWIVGNGVGLGLGGIGTATRALVGSFTPAHRTAEFFGLWGLTYKLAGAIGLLIFGAVRATLGSVPSLVVLASFFVGGGLILLSVRPMRGVRAARRAERENAAKFRRDSGM